MDVNRKQELVRMINEFAEKYSVPLVVKEGRRLSAATLAMIDDLGNGIKEMDEALAAMQKCRDGMSKRIETLRNGAPEETENAEENMDDEKSIDKCVINIVG